MNNPFWSAMMGGITNRMKALGMDTEKTQVSAIILAPMDTSGVTEALQVRVDAGIPIITLTYR